MCYNWIFFLIKKKKKKAFKEIEIEWWPWLLRKEKGGEGAPPWGRGSCLFQLLASPLSPSLWVTGQSVHGDTAPVAAPRGPRVAVCSGPVVPSWVQLARRAGFLGPRVAVTAKPVRWLAGGCNRQISCLCVFATPFYKGKHNLKYDYLVL